MRSFVRTLIFILAVAGSGCKKLKVQRVESEKESGSAVSIRNFSRDSFDKEGKLKWKLKAKEAYIFPKENKTVLYSLRFKQFEKEKEQSTILADKGIIDHSIKVVLLNGNIQVDGVEDRKIIAEELHYDLNTEKLSSDKEVTIISKGTTIRGKGLRADKNLNKYTILKPSAISVSNPLKNNANEGLNQ